MADSDSDYEEILVGVEFNDPVQKYTRDIDIKIIGLETKTPIFQYGKQVLQGKWCNALGTKLFFAPKPITEASDPAFVPQVNNHYECVYMTEKVLRLTSCALVPREDMEGEDTEPESEGAPSDVEEAPQSQANSSAAN